MSNSDSPAATTPSTTPSSAQKPKQHSRNTRKKRSATKLITIIDHNIGLKPKYPKQEDPDAAVVSRPCTCTECGKKFWSWKALFGHMRCHPEREWRGINPPPKYQRQPPEKQIPGSFMNMITQEEQEVAACLLLLAKGDNQESGSSGLNGRFECSSCKKVFGSHQALGGHRASHKNVKGCFAITNVVEEQNNTTSRGTGDHDNEEEEESSDGGHEMVMDMVLEGHKCSICLRVFSSGQALGGHKRCHWEPEPSNSAKEACGGVDLNLPAPLHDCSSPLTLDLRLGL